MSNNLLLDINRILLSSVFGYLPEIFIISKPLNKTCLCSFRIGKHIDSDLIELPPINSSITTDSSVVNTWDRSSVVLGICGVSFSKYLVFSLYYPPLVTSPRERNFLRFLPEQQNSNSTVQCNNSYYRVQSSHRVITNITFI